MSSIETLANELRRRSATARAAGLPYVVGVSGGVAAGKSTFAAGLRAAIEGWPENPAVEAVATDGFLFPNHVLADRGISMRKGFPESFDVASLRSTLAQIRRGEHVAVPRYSHVTYDVTADDPHLVRNPAVVILDGLHLAQIESDGAPRLIDWLIYLDAEEAAIEAWFTARLLPLMVDGRDDPDSFYYQFRDWDDAARTAFASRVWQNINLPNLRDHIVKDRDAAHTIVRKAADHAIVAIEPRAL